MVLLDEIEKAHTDMHELFFQVFDKGWMEDGEGRYIDFKNTVIILTTNVGTERVMDACKDPDLIPEDEGLNALLRDPLRRVFLAALLGQLVTILYYPLSDGILAKIVQLQLKQIMTRLKDNHHIDLNINSDVANLIVSRCTEVESGIRIVDATLSNTILPNISHQLLENTSQDKQITQIDVTVVNNQFNYDFYEH